MPSNLSDPHGPVGKSGPCGFWLGERRLERGRRPLAQTALLPASPLVDQSGPLAKLTQTANNSTMVCTEDFQPADFAAVVGAVTCS
jgi:hypothetical protein